MEILRGAIILIAVIGAGGMTLLGNLGRWELIVLWIACGVVVGLIGGIRALIVVAAIIGGGYLAGAAAQRYYGHLPGEWGIAADWTTITLFIPAGAIACGMTAAILTRKRTRPPDG